MDEKAKRARQVLASHIIYHLSGTKFVTAYRVSAVIFDEPGAVLLADVMEFDGLRVGAEVTVDVDNGYWITHNPEQGWAFHHNSDPDAEAARRDVVSGRRLMVLGFARMYGNIVRRKSKVTLTEVFVLLAVQGACGNYFTCRTGGAILLFWPGCLTKVSEATT